jgi:hypothetical protein
MAVSEAVSSPTVDWANAGVTVDYIRHWCVICDRFNEWQHKRIIGSSPAPPEQERHRQELKWLLRLTKLMHYTASDPEFPDRSVVDLLEARIWQLEQAWNLLYRPLSHGEIEAAESVLKEVFPDEPGA